MVAEKYKSACYFYQPTRMMDLFRGDFRRVSASCATAPVRYQVICFESMGRRASDVSKGKPYKAIQSCRHASEGEPQVRCLIGAVQQSFWDPAEQDKALKFCKVLKAKNEIDACYEMIFSRAPQILSLAEMHGFCVKVEAPYRTSCLKKRTALTSPFAPASR
jgi:hypothetical protein